MAAIAAAFASSPAAAQAVEPFPGMASSSPSECGGKAAVYQAGKVQVWVLRQGTLREENPLRPLSPTMLTVLQVVVNGRSATAFGPDFDNMRQGGAPARLEEASGNRIAWSRTAEGLPTSFRVVSEDGRVLLGPLAFQSCGDAPKVAPEKPSRQPSTAGRERRRDAQDGGNRPGLPQGAIPSGGGGGLSLPQP